MVDLSSSPLRPRWTYTDSAGAVDYSMALPQRPWDFGSRALGGSDTSAAGVPAAFEIRRDYLLHLTLRFPVDEWNDVERLVRHLQRGGVATFYPDRGIGTVSHTIYGDSPAMGEEIRPRRSEEPSTLELDISIRRSTEAIFTDRYYGHGSGAPVEVTSGKWIGFTDFSEFSVGAGLPSGITEFGIGTGSPTAVEIANDEDEGNYFKMTGQDLVHAWGFGVDSFFGLIEFGEMLGRVYSSFNATNRHSIGPVFSLQGLLGEPSPDINFTGGTLYWPTSGPVESDGASVVNGSGGLLLNNSDMQEPLQNYTWCWFRIRRTQNGGDPAKGDWQGTAWYGAFEDEPASIDGSAIAAPAAPRGKLALGWGMTPVGSLNEQRIAYLSFSNDPDTTPPPIPS